MIELELNIIAVTLFVATIQAVVMLNARPKVGNSPVQPVHLAWTQAALVKFTVEARDLPSLASSTTWLRSHSSLLGTKARSEKGMAEPTKMYETLCYLQSHQATT